MELAVQLSNRKYHAACRLFRAKVRHILMIRVYVLSPAIRMAVPMSYVLKENPPDLRGATSHSEIISVNSSCANRKIESGRGGK